MVKHCSYTKTKISNISKQNTQRMRQNFACGVEKNFLSRCHLYSLIFNIFQKFRNFCLGEPESNVKTRQKFLDRSCQEPNWNNFSNRQRFLRTSRKMSHPSEHLNGNPNSRYIYHDNTLKVSVYFDNLLLLLLFQSR